MAGDVIKEFLVSLGFKIDGASERKFSQGVVGATKTVVALAVAAEAAAVAVGFAVAKISRSLEDLHWQSERTNASAKNIKSLSYAVSQLGGSYDGARQSIEQFGANLRTNPGYSSLVRSLGVATEKNGKLRDTAEVLQDIGKALKTKPYYQAVQYANALGIDERTFRALQSGDLSKWQEEYRAKVAAIGVDQTEAAKRGAEFTRSLRSLNETFGAMGEKLANDLAPAFAKFLDQVNNFLLQNADKISSFFGECAKGAAMLATGFAKLIELAEPLWKGFDQIARSLTGEGGVAVAVAALGAAISASLLLRIAGLVGIVGRLAGGLTLLKSALALIGGGAGVAAGAALVASTSELNAGEDAEIARRRAEGSWGGGKPATEAPARDTRNVWQKYAPKALGGQDAPSGPISGGTFAEKAPSVMKKLMKDLNISHEDAAVIMGNLGHESNGFKTLQEVSPTVPGSRGGYGWAQWTGPRRKEFEAWAKEKGLDPKSDEANYGFLVHELRGKYKSSVDALRANPNKDDALVKFEESFEGAGIKAYTSRFNYREKALRAYRADAERPAAPEAPKTTVAAAAIKPVANSEDAALVGSRHQGENLPDAPSAEKQRIDMRKLGLPPIEWGKGIKIPAPAFDVAKMGSISANAATINGGAGAPNAPLMPAATAGGDTNVNMNQKTEINVIGSSDPGATAGAVAAQQGGVNGGMLRNFQGAVR